MLLHDLLNERIINLHSPAEKARYASEVWDLLQSAYQPVGGFKSAASADELVHDSGLWKLVKRGNAVTAVNIYKDSFGRKSIASGTNASPQGKQDYGMIKDEDIKFRRAWAEVSGPVERVMARAGAKPLPARFAEFLTGKKILDFSDDGVHYTRLIAGHPHEKVIYGFINLSQADLDQLAELGVDIRSLPEQIRVKNA